MSKKKQLTGKKTKLAKLPLTQALSQQMTEENSWDPASTPVDTAAAPVETTINQMPLSWERVEEGAAGLLAATYILLIQEFQNLQSEFPDVAGEAGAELLSQPANVPPIPQLKQTLSQIRDDLSELSRLLAD
jgi:hypothetical protein